MWEHSGGHGWDGVSGTDPRDLPDVCIMQREVRIEKEHLTPLEARRIVQLFGNWTFDTDTSWNFSVIDGNNYIKLRSTCPNVLFKEFIYTVLQHILNGA